LKKIVALATVSAIGVTVVWVTTMSERRVRAAEARVRVGMSVVEVFQAVEDWLVCYIRPDDNAPSTISSPDRPFDVSVNGRGNLWIEGSGFLKDQEVTSRARLGELLAPPLSAGRAWRLSFKFDGIPTSRLILALDGQGRVAQVEVVKD
jgi:hypothetical protein